MGLINRFSDSFSGAAPLHILPFAGGVRGIGQAGGFGCPGGMSCPIAGPGVFSSGLSLGLLFPYALHLTVVLLARVVAYAVRVVCSSILLGG